MIKIDNLTKRFDETVALNQLSCDIAEGAIFGLAGSNGSGKSTLLRTISGVYEPDGGCVYIDEEESFDNEKVKEKCYYIPDYPWFFNDSTVENLAMLIRNVYPEWSEERFRELCKIFPIETDKKIVNMSKGMQRQASLILAFAARPKYLFLDEIFDGLDPVIRKNLKKLLIEDVSDRGMTCIIASHNLREIDDICDKIVLLHKGEMVTNDDTDELKNQINKVQLAFNEMPEGDIFEGLDVEIHSRVGNYFNVMIRGDLDEALEQINRFEPSFLQVLPSTLEEVFIKEMEDVGYGKH